MLYSVIAELFLKCIWHLYSLGKFKHWKSSFFQMCFFKGYYFPCSFVCVIWLFSMCQAHS